ncbi:hypothetical protein KPATCC21470_8645 [Kitasatospora purpeofusca]
MVRADGPAAPVDGWVSAVRSGHRPGHVFKTLRLPVDKELWSFISQPM